MQIPAILDGGRRWIMARLVLNGAFQAGAMIGTALLIQQFFDGFVSGLDEGAGTVNDLALLSIALVLVALASAGMRYFERVDAERLGQLYIHEIRSRVFSHLTALPPRVLRTRRHGSLILRFLGDLTAIRQWVSLGIARLSVALAVTLITLAALVIINTFLGLAVTFGVLAGGGLTYLIGRPFEGIVREVRRRRSRLAANVNEKFLAVSTVIAHAQRRNERRRMRRQSRALADSMIRRARMVGGIRALVHGVVTLAMVLVLVVGAFEVGAGRATAGMVVAAISLVAILTPPVRDLGRVYEYWQNARVSREKLTNLLELGPTVEQHARARSIKAGPGRIEFRDVSVRGALRHVTATAEGGSLVVITGPNAAGKSTLLELPPRFMDADSGSIFIDGVDIERLRLGGLRRSVGIVSTSVPLLRGTVEENLRYAAPDASSDAIMATLASVGLDAAMDLLPNGLKTRLVEGATNLSVGQRQLVSLARAFMGNPQILLLDEADSNLDDVSRRLFKAAVAAFEGTILMVTHRDEWLSAADAVWDLMDGEMLVRGPIENVVPFQTAVGPNETDGGGHRA